MRARRQFIHALGASKKIVVWAQKFFVLFSVDDAGLCCWAWHFVTFGYVVGPGILFWLCCRSWHFVLVVL